ncbi:protein dispatched-like [Nylanderia fulva]|uniref:protein dispatched-like n=1 Tax=Nylanderia fulva TaxID=613905 RepID=UPI0010FBBE31|nr:protein dispatched-like [Nylanderia fulva]
MKTSWFPRLIAHHPYIILMVIFAFSSICLIIPLTTKKLPDFSDPQMGFEARGSVLAQRLTAWHNLIEEATKTRGELTGNPLEYHQYLRQLNQQSSMHQQNHSLSTSGILKIKSKDKNKQKEQKHPKLLNITSLKETSDENKDKWGELRELKDEDDMDIMDDKNRNHFDNDFFCNLPTSSYARVVIAVDSEEKNLWSMEGILAQCHIDDVLRANAHFSSLCQTEEHNSHKCCRSWSPANYVALLSNRSSCLGVTENDLSRVKTLLQQCASYYHNHKLLPNCAEDFDCQKDVPTECYMRNAAYHLLHYLLDVNFIPKIEPKNKQNLTLQSAMLFLPIAASSAAIDFYKAIENDDLMYGNFRVQGMQLGLKSTLFDRLLISDASLVLAGFLFVTLCILAYTGSIVLTITTIFAVIFSLGISYAVYTLVLRIEFFPFMNIMAIVVAVGIGADDAFIYCKVWESEKQQKLSNGGLVHLVQTTMKHAVPSMFVTSLTTAVAFFASIISNVTSINCFSLFAGITVIVNFFLMITWLPACVVVSEHCKFATLSPLNFITRKIIRPLQSLGDKVTKGFTAFLTGIVISLRWLLLLSLGTIAIICCIIVFHHPGLQVPDYIDFQLFHNTHPFERYDLKYSQKFWFERYEMIGSGGDVDDDVGGDGGGEVLPLRFVWGIKPTDNGDYLNPREKGTLDYDTSFDISNPKSQKWLDRFCKDLRSQPFYRSTSGPMLLNCFIEPLYEWMKRRCKSPIKPYVDENLPCCESNMFPYKPSILQQCAAELSMKIYNTPHKWIQNNPVFAGPKFFNDPFFSSNDTLSVKVTPKIKALIVEYDSTYAYTLSFAKMDKFFHQVESWMQDQLRSAPRGMRGGWFISRLEFYELQRTLYEGTIWTMGVSLALALIVLVMVTLNPLVSLYAIVTVGATIIVTVAILILFGWKLDVLESVAISTAIGLAVDFSLHYAVSYRTCIFEKKIDRVRAALEKMGGPTLMAAITSGAAGALMLPSHVLAYIQIGIFLLLVMSISWIYATLFLCSMLAIIGPSSRFAQFEYSRADHKSLGGLGTSRWLEALWEPSAGLFALPGGLDMLDISGDGDARLICADLGPVGDDSTKIRVYKGGDQVTEHNMMDPPCGVVGFYTENGEHRSSVIAVGAGASVYIFKNMRPFFKYCLPHIDAHPKEREIWHKCGLDEEINVLTLVDDLELLLKELGASYLSPRTLKFLSLDNNLRLSFVEQYRRLPLVKVNALTTIAIIRRDSWNDPASSCLILGTEVGEVLILDPRAFSIMDKHQLEWPPVSFASCGLWTGDGRIMVIGRDGKIGAIRRGSPVKLWEPLPAPAVAISILTSEGAAVAVMDGTLVGFSKRGIKLWYISIPGMILDLVSLPVPQSGLSLLAVSTAGYGVRIYDGKHHVDTVKIMEPVSALKYGRMGQEERTIAMITVGGGLCMKILKRTADFNVNNSISNSSSCNTSKFSIPKKTRLFVDQTIRERAEAKKIHNTFQQGFLRLRLTTAKRASENLSETQVTGPNPITLEANVLGLGPNYMIRIIVTNISEGLSYTELYLLCRPEDTDVNPRVIDLPLLPSAIPIPITVSANLKGQISGKIKILLCKKSNPKPLAVTTVILPAAEEDFEI